MAEYKLLDALAMDEVVLDLFEHWQHVPWFWKSGEAGEPVDDVLRRNFMRSIQISRARHPNTSVLDWLSADSPKTLFVAAMAFSGANNSSRPLHTQGLLLELSKYWDDASINKVFSWMRSHDPVAWRRCQANIKSDKGSLAKVSYSVYENLSPGIHEYLALCQNLDITPTHEILASVTTANTGTLIPDIGNLL